MTLHLLISLKITLYPFSDLRIKVYTHRIHQFQVSITQLEIDAFDAVADFNVGSKAAVLIYEKLGMFPGMNMLKGCLTKNMLRPMNTRR